MSSTSNKNDSSPDYWRSPSSSRRASIGGDPDRYRCGPTEPGSYWCGHKCLYCNYDTKHPPSIRPPLPRGKNLEGRPVWEPPIFDYSALIDEEYDKKREAVLKHFGGDQAKTTNFMDLDDDEYAILYMYDNWLDNNCQVSGEQNDMDMMSWFDALELDLRMDLYEVVNEHLALNLYLEKGDDGEWVVKLDSGHPDYHETSESHFREDDTSSCPQHGHLHASDTQPPPSWDLQYTFISHDQLQDTTSPSPEAPLSQTSPSLVIDPSPTSNKNKASIELASETEAEPAPFDLFTIWT